MTNWQRFLIIIQLCLAFSLILWYAFQPFMGEYFALRSRMLLYEYVLGTSDIVKNKMQQADKLNRNARRFAELKEADRDVIKQDYQQWQNYAQRSAWAKILDGMKVLFLRIPPFQLAWMFFAAVICILLLLRKSEAKLAAWLLPIIALAYAVDNQASGYELLKMPDEVLFPSESVIVNEYLHATDKLGISKDQLQEGWENYLVANWGGSGEVKADKLEEAEFNFTVARLMLLKEQPPNIWLASFHEKSPLWLLALYFLWNVYFARAVNMKKASS